MIRRYAIDARTATSHFPGIGRYVRSLLGELAAQLSAHEQLVYFCSAQQKARLGLPEDPRISWHRAQSSPFGLRQQWEIPRLLRQARAHVYHSPYYLMPYWPGVPTVLTVYDIIPLHFPQHVSPRARLLFNLTTRLALRRATNVIAISNATRDDFISHFGVVEQRITATPLAAANHFRPAPVDLIAGIRRRLSLKGPYALYVGSNKPHKNLARLLEAWQIVVGRMTEPRYLVLAGRLAAHDDDLSQRVDGLGLRDSVRFVRDVSDEDLVPLYTGAEVFVFPSLYEGFGLPVLEAMACGCAVACGNRSSMPEIAGQAARYFDPDNSSEIASAVLELFLDASKRETFHQRALRRASAFSWARTAAETLRIYRRVAPDA